MLYYLREHERRTLRLELHTHILRLLTHSTIDIVTRRALMANATINYEAYIPKNATYSAGNQIKPRHPCKNCLKQDQKSGKLTEGTVKDILHQQLSAPMELRYDYRR